MTISAEQRGDFFRETGELTGEDLITIPALQPPTAAELDGDFDLICEKDGVDYDISPTGIVTLRLGTVLRPDENWISDEEYELRRKLVPDQFGYQQLKWLVDNQKKYRGLTRLRGKIYIDGTGLVVVGKDGHRHSPRLSAGRDEPWFIHWSAMSYGGLHSYGRIASSSPSVSTGGTSKSARAVD